MHIALVSPFPPSKSGIADYSVALADALSPLTNLTLVRNEGELPRIAQADLPLYQIGNNDNHGFVYEEAIRRPGVVVLHEANLHHLMAEITIKRGNWERYLREVEFDGGPDALEYAEAVRRLEVGPDYDGVPMLRRVLGAARGLIVHSNYVAAVARECGYQGPVAVIPHGAWLPEVDGSVWRSKLGIGAGAPLIGTFGHLKPYKRIREMLRAFQSLVRRNPFAKLILVGEEHPDLPLSPLLSALDLEANTRVISHTPIDEFVGYMAACDIIVNLRYPTVGESSGSMLRALGLGKPVIVSEVGSFAEFPDDVCLKVPVGGHAEEELIFEYLRYLTENPDAARVLGKSARFWVSETCNWDRVASEYLSFCERVATDTWLPPQPVEEEKKEDQAEGDEAVDAPDSEQDAVSGLHGQTEDAVGAFDCSEDLPLAAVSDQTPVELETPTEVEDLPQLEPVEVPTSELPSASEVPEAEIREETVAVPENIAAVQVEETPPSAPAPILQDLQETPVIPQLEHPIAREMISWAPNDDARKYLMQHLSRLVDTIEMLPEGDEDSRILEMGCYMQITPLLRETKHYGEVRGCYFGELGKSHEQMAEAPDGRTFACMVDEFDAERDPYPYPDEHFDAVVCTELFEHLSMDPMHCLWEMNRILKPGGCVLLSTPNVCSLRAIAAILGGYHPGFFPAFIKPGPDGPADPRHHREYAPREIQQGLEDAGFTVTAIRTGAYWSAPAPEHAWVEHLLEHYELDTTQRGECIFALGTKTSTPRVRFPQWLYYS